MVNPTLRGSHFSPSARSYHWNRVRCSAGFGNVDLYLATRHYVGWYADALDLPPHVIALQFGHQDGGELVRSTYGHQTPCSRASACAKRSAKPRQRRFRS